MTEPTEAEVEAACRAECGFDKMDFDGLSRLVRVRYMSRCRAALTAAAQVRERAPEPTKLSAAEVARIFLERERTYQSRPFDEFTVTRLEQLILRARSDGAATASLMPIYGATEDTPPAEASREQPTKEIVR